MPTLSELQERRALVLDALKAAYNGQSYSRGSAGGSNLSFTRQSIAELRLELDRIDADIARMSSSVGKLMYVRPRDN